MSIKAKRIRKTLRQFKFNGHVSFGKQDKSIDDFRVWNAENIIFYHRKNKRKFV
jgi:hypothetical protein